MGACGAGTGGVAVGVSSATTMEHEGDPGGQSAGAASGGGRWRYCWNGTPLLQIGQVGNGRWPASQSNEVGC